MKQLKMKTLLCSGVLLLVAAALPVHAATLNLDQLLQQVKSGRVNDSKENSVRLKAFKADKAVQSQKLSQMKSVKATEEARSAALEAEFEINEVEVVALEVALKERLGGLKELFGVVQQAAGDARGQFDSSITQLQFKDRSEFLSGLAKKMGQSNQLASMDDLEQLWFELQREMTESAKVVKFETKVITATGKEEAREVTRVGLFNVVSDGKYLQYVPETGNLVELGRQPKARFLSKITDLESANNGFTSFAVDPSRGQLLSLLVQSPNLLERVKQGGVVGYIILGLGAIALLIALERIITLGITGMKVRRQIKTPDTARVNNPLGRVLKIFEDNPASDTETLELKLSEGVLKETGKLNARLMFLKVIAVVAPLMGLLGTVTGMIVTFQAITLFGTGDPKLMAGGISQALVTTVLGLVVAIPTVFFHTLTSTRAKRLAQILEEQATGMVASRSERSHLGG
ncbi:MAG: MotA/TolQ/ExbB proton channel family protein [Arenicellales bacterium]